MADSIQKFRRLYSPRRGATVWFIRKEGQKPLIFVKGYRPRKGGILDFNGLDFVPPNAELVGGLRLPTTVVRGLLELPPKSIHELSGALRFPDTTVSGLVSAYRLHTLAGRVRLNKPRVSGELHLEAPFLMVGEIALTNQVTVSGNIEYDPDLFRGVTGSLHLPYGKAGTRLTAVSGLFARTAKVKRFYLVGYTVSTKLGSDTSSPYSATDKFRVTRIGLSDTAKPLRSEAIPLLYNEAIRMRVRATTVFNHALPVIRMAVRDDYSDMLRKRRSLHFSFNRADKFGYDHVFSYNGSTTSVHRMYRAPWNIADKLRVTKFRKPSHPTPKPPQFEVGAGNDLTFCKLYNPRRKMKKNYIYFGLLRCKRPMDIESGESYIMLNEVTVTLLNTGEILDPTQATMDTDGSSWCAAMSMSLSEADVKKLRAVSGDMALIEISVASDKFVFMFESATRSRTFGSDSFSVKGRNVTALLDSPHSETISYTNTVATSAYEIARQIVAQAVGDSVSVVWEDLIDTISWQVPAYAFTVAGKTPIQALKELVEPIGGIVVSHPSLPRLVIRKAYRKPFWNLEDSEHDYTLPESMMVSEGVSDDPIAAKNAVFVVDTLSGDYSKVYRLGSSGNALAASISSSLYSTDQLRREAGLRTLIESNPSTEYSYSFFKPTAVHHMQPYDRLHIVGEETHHWGYLDKVSLGFTVNNDTTNVVYSVSLKSYTGVQVNEE